KPYFSLPQPLHLLLGSHARCGVVAAALAVTCYWNSLECGLVHDDIFAIRDNADVRPGTPLASAFSDDFWGKPMSSNVSHKSYRPLTILSFRANYALHGLEPCGYHAANVGLHAVVTVMVGWLCRRLVFPEPDLTFLVMCLFASHPVHTEAVTGVVGRAELLSSVCFLISLISYTTSLSHSPYQQTLRVLVSILLGGVAMLFKETGATVFGVCLAYDLLVHSRLQLLRCLVKRTSPVFPTLSPLLLRSLSLLLTSTLLLITRVLLLHGNLPRFSDHDNPASFSPLVLTRALTYSYLYFFNARLLTFPLTLCYDWQMGSIPLVETLADTRNTGTLLFFIFLLSLSISSLFRFSSRKTSSRGVLLSLLVMVVPFLPASNLLFRVGFVVAERVLYIPSIGYCILLVQGVKTISLRLRPLPHPPTASPLPPSPRAPRSHLPLFLLVLLLVGLFSVRTVVRNSVWTSRESLFRSGLATVPHNAKIHYNYANYLSDSGRLDEAAHHYYQALRLAPDHASSHNNLGSLPGLDLHEAEFHFREAVRYNPTHYRALYNLGNNLLNQGRLEEAEKALRESLRLVTNQQ
ncbi:Protein O-mannosyl-transferase TMTC1, partial [Geodia barretti]